MSLQFERVILDKIRDIRSVVEYARDTTISFDAKQQFKIISGKLRELDKFIDSYIEDFEKEG